LACSGVMRDALLAMSGVTRDELVVMSGVRSGAEVAKRQKRSNSAEFSAYDLAGLAASIVTTDRPKKKGTGTMAGPPIALAFGNNRRRGRRFALAVRCSVGLCRGRDAKESHRRCRQ
jgi:hypothetical protein